MEAVNASTIWTWNAIGKRKGAWSLDTDVPEARKAFLMNHLINELLPPKGDGMRWSNSDPVTGQAAWYDLGCASRRPSRRRRANRASRRWPSRAASASIPTNCATARSGPSDVASRCSACQETRPGHRPRRLCRLPRLRHQLQGVEHRRLRRSAVGPGPLRRRRVRHLPQPGPYLRGDPGRRRDRRRGGRGAHRAFPEILPALRRRALRHRLPDRRLLQAHRGRHRAGRRGHVHRLRPVCLGLSLWRARDGPRRRRDEEVHALRRPHLQRDDPGNRPGAVLRPDLPGQCAPLWRPCRSRSRTSR